LLKNSIVFLGTGGGRVVVFRQLRHSGGIWLNIGGENILIDPGPGSLIRIYERGLDTKDIDVIVVSHRHLDHSNDLNAVIEASTESTKKPLGLLVAPEDVVDGEDPILLKYLRKGLSQIQYLKPNWETDYQGIKIKGTVKHLHKGAETIGVEFHHDGKVVSYVPCGKFFEGMLEGYTEGADIMIFNTTFPEPKEGYYHLSVPDVEKMINRYKPKKAVLTHFSVAMLKSDPQKIATKLSRKVGIPVVSAYDGMKITF